jgi:hypothetical protein
MYVNISYTSFPDFHPLKLGCLEYFLWQDNWSVITVDWEVFHYGFQHTETVQKFQYHIYSNTTCSMFEDFIWVVQSATCGNIQDTAVNLAVSLAQAVSAVGQSKKPGLHTFCSLAAGSKEQGCTVSCQSQHDYLLYTGVHMKCIPFYCNISHEPKGRGMKTKHI